MITKYKLFENNTIRYISNGFNECPVCGSENYDTHVEYDYQECKCHTCDFLWYKYTEDIFNNSFTINQKRIINGHKDTETDIYFKSDGKNTCPYCDSDDYDITKTESDDFELIDYMKCDDCEKEWIKFYDNTVISTSDSDDKEIIKGNIVNNTLIDLGKYKKNKASKFNI
jgi:Zn finger protein HypA/HybF involved in hydrogenase expression